MTTVGRPASPPEQGVEPSAGGVPPPAELAPPVIQFDITDFTRLSAIGALLRDDKTVDGLHLLGNFLDQLQARWNDAAERQSAKSLVDRLGSLGEEILAELRHIKSAFGTESRSSVEITVDSKGIVKPTVKVYAIDPDEADATAQRIFDDLFIKYAPSKAES